VEALLELLPLVAVVSAQRIRSDHADKDIGQLVSTTPATQIMGP